MNRHKYFQNFHFNPYTFNFNLFWLLSNLVFEILESDNLNLLKISRNKNVRKFEY